jgi:hypothetical protein
MILFLVARWEKGEGSTIKGQYGKRTTTDGWFCGSGFWVLGELPAGWVRGEG